MMAVAGAAMVWRRLPSSRQALSLSFASRDFTNTTRIGQQLELVGPIFASS